MRRFLLPFVFVLAACQKETAEKQTPVAQLPPVERPRMPAPGDPDCPSDGLWKQCALLDRITRSGMSIKPQPDSVSVPFLSVRGVRYTVGKSASLIAFYYRDTLALARDVVRLDTVTAAPKGDTIAPWHGTATYIRSANLLAIFESANPEHIERMQLAITAGAPQPPSNPGK